ncbi:hypothetical protein TruAng_003092 [Truncatella angustata]|nr:hypothetical protein TruAng_003092 [Truncatella angustata]
MDGASARLQCEFNASPCAATARSTTHNAAMENAIFLRWLQEKREDALSDWRRLRRRVLNEHLNSDRVEKEMSFFKSKYGRYYEQINIHQAPHVQAPWAAEKNTTELPKDEQRDGRDNICSQSHCRQRVPQSGSFLDSSHPQCGVCGANIDVVQYNQCGECTTKICVDCAKPVTYPFDPDYGFFPNLWYKFYDNIWDPPDAYGGFEKYLRREHRLGISKFDVEDLYTPGFHVDPDDEDTTLYSYVAPKKDKNEEGTSSSTPAGAQGHTPGPRSPTPGAHGCTVNADKETDPGVARRIKRANVRIGRECRVRRVDFGHSTPPPQGYDDGWFSQNNLVLYELSCKWSETYFAKRNLPESYNDRTWFTRLNAQFIQYANLVAHEDIFFGPKFNDKVDGWEHIIRDRKNRKWLIVGMLGQIIEKKIYVELLFGATAKEEKHLNQQDNDYIVNDGYQRAAARSHEINMVMGGKAVPDLFWEKVDSLTAYTANILQELFALTNIMDEGNDLTKYEKLKLKRNNDIAFMYAELHFIIAHAAYFHVCMRRSSSIFHFLSATPAARMDYPIEGQACYELYKLSKEEAERREKVESVKTKAELTELSSQPEYTEKEQSIRKLKLHHRFEAHHRFRGAKVKFAVWPMITRYRPENIGQPIVRPTRGLRFDDNDVPSQDEIESGEGQRIIEIGKCLVVYYQGIIYPKDKSTTSENFEADGSPLLYYLSTEKPAQTTEAWKRTGSRKFLFRLVAAGAIFLTYLLRTWILGHWNALLTIVLAASIAIIYHIFFRTLFGSALEAGMLSIVLIFATLLGDTGLSTWLYQWIGAFLSNLGWKYTVLLEIGTALLAVAARNFDPRLRDTWNTIFGITTVLCLGTLFYNSALMGQAYVNAIGRWIMSSLSLCMDHLIEMKDRLSLTRPGVVISLGRQDSSRYLTGKVVIS